MISIRTSVISQPVTAKSQFARVVGGILPCSKVGSELYQRPALTRPIVKTRCTTTLSATATNLPQQQNRGVKWIPAFGSVLVGAVILICTVQSGLFASNPKGWTLLSIFVSTIVGLVAEPLPTGAWAFLGITTAVSTKTLTFSQAFGAFCNDVIWLIVVSFFFAKAFEKTGLGERVANIFVKLMGKSTLGLAYGLAVAETVISPAMPSTSARAGGIFMPIIKSLAIAQGSTPGATANKVGNYLIMSQFQTSSHSSVMYMTGAAQNLLCMKLAADAGVFISNQWVTWFTAAFVPAAVGVLITPFLVYKLFPPEIKQTPEAPQQAQQRLDEMGPATRDQKLLLITMGAAVTLWVFGDTLGISSVVTAMMGLCMLLITGVLSWKDCLTNSSAWDTLTWFAILVGMSGQLNNLGIIKYFSDSVGGVLASSSLSWPYLFGALNLVYYYLHYMFASQTAHVGALYSAFLVLMLASGVPPVLAALSLGFNSNLFGAMAHYSSGQAAVYYGAGYLKLDTIFKGGFIFSVISLLIWSTIGVAWWKLTGFI
eukprot:TRINITY_DN10269_c0_g1_i4.p1 TRINITY_DN10269_c0_g1~~TRINITY_DN10269_c0_g1_i4.p1  ORF type:complete len:590 (+),score=25.39 TRINITY_DN10269_c0_g1_i4:148-1770(+)